MRRRVLLMSGVATLAVVWLGPLPRLAAEHFSAHMTVHMAVVAIAAPLLALATATRWWCGPSDGSACVSAIAASVVELVVVWTWHTPLLHHAARTSAAAFVAEQATFLASGYAVWFFALAQGSRPDGSRSGAGIVALLLTSMHMTLLGALIGLAPRPLYSHVSAPDIALADQHLGGAIMLLVGGTAYLAGGLALAARLVRGPRLAAAPGGHP
jgi:putative membrane protein